MGMSPRGFLATHQPVTISGNVVPQAADRTRTCVVSALMGTSSGRGAPHPNCSRAEPSGSGLRPCTAGKESELWEWEEGVGVLPPRSSQSKEEIIVDDSPNLKSGAAR